MSFLLNYASLPFRVLRFPLFYETMATQFFVNDPSWQNSWLPQICALIFLKCEIVLEAWEVT